MSSKEKFYSSVNDRKISDKENKHVLNVWKKFETKTMKDYHNLYLKCDVLLLPDMFEKIINNSLKDYNWDAILKMTKIELELIADPDLYIFFGKATRSGFSYISNRYSEANNRYLKSYNQKEESKHILRCE